jgi:hypothetical protein
MASQNPNFCDLKALEQGLMDPASGWQSLRSWNGFRSQPRGIARQLCVAFRSMIRLRGRWPAKRCIFTNLPIHKQANKCLIFESRLLLELDSERVACISSQELEVCPRNRFVKASASTRTICETQGIYQLGNEDRKVLLKLKLWAAKIAAQVAKRGRGRLKNLPVFEVIHLSCVRLALA